MALFKSFTAAGLGLAMAAGLALDADAKTFRVAVGDAAGSPQEALGLAFQESLQELSGGAHDIQMFMNGQLGSEQDTVQDAALGTLDMSILASNNISPFSPELGVLSLPYVIQSLEEAELLTQGEIGQELIDATIENAGVRILAWTYSGFRVLTNSQKPVESVADLEGLVIRVPKNEIMIATYNAWGVNPTPMAWSETFTALQQGVVDGQDTPLATIQAMKFYEVQQYLTKIRYLFLIEPLVISEQVFQGLSEEDQNTLLEAGKAATLASAAYLRDAEATAEAYLAEQGMEIIEAADGEAEWIQLAMENVWPNYYDAVGGKEKVDAILAALGR